LVTDVFGFTHVKLDFGVKRSKIKVTAGGRRWQPVEFHLVCHFMNIGGFVDLGESSTNL